MALYAFKPSSFELQEEITVLLDVETPSFLYHICCTLKKQDRHLYETFLFMYRISVFFRFREGFANNSQRVLPDLIILSKIIFQA